MCNRGLPHHSIAPVPSLYRFSVVPVPALQLFWVGPFTGAILAAIVYEILFRPSGQMVSAAATSAQPDSIEEMHRVWIEPLGLHAIRRLLMIGLNFVRHACPPVVCHMLSSPLICTC